MSYILDALRKADAQRERDPSRGIHAQPAAGLPAPAASRAQPWWWGVAALVAVGVAAAYVLLQRPSAPPPATVPVTGFVKLEPPKPVVQVATELSPPAPPPLPAPPPRAPMKTPVAATTLKAPPPVAGATPAAASAPAAPAAAQAAGPAVQASATDRIVNVADLPAAVQSELPKLAISGGVHSENAAQRMLIVGGQLKMEGAELAPGLVLEQIRPRTAVLRFKGFRYSQPY